MAAFDNKIILAALEVNWHAEMEGSTPIPLSLIVKRTRIVGMRCEGLRWLRSITPIFGQNASRKLGGTEPQFTGNPNGQADSLANRVGGPDLALRRLEIDEGRDIAKYAFPLDRMRFLASHKRRWGATSPGPLRAPIAQHGFVSRHVCREPHSLAALSDRGVASRRDEDLERRGTRLHIPS